MPSYFFQGYGTSRSWLPIPNLGGDVLAAFQADRGWTVRAFHFNPSIWNPYTIDFDVSLDSPVTEVARVRDGVFNTFSRFLDDVYLEGGGFGDIFPVPSGTSRNPFPLPDTPIVTQRRTQQTTTNRTATVNNVPMANFISVGNGLYKEINTNDCYTLEDGVYVYYGDCPSGNRSSKSVSNYLESAAAYLGIGVSTLVIGTVVFLILTRRD